MTDQVKISDLIDSVGIDKLAQEQKQELFECIRHFNKYKAYSQFNSAFAVPGEADAAIQSLIKLYELHYESSKTAPSQ